MTKSERYLVWLAILILGITLAPWLMKFGAWPISHSTSDWSSFGSYLGGVLSPLATLLGVLAVVVTLSHSRQAATDQQNFQNAVTSLSRAYTAIAPIEGQSGPRNDRLAWLTCARHLLAAKLVSVQISSHSPGLLAAFESEREFVRHNLYLLFNGKEAIGLSFQYFTRGEEHLDERSIRTIFEFIAWPETNPDVISNVKRYSDGELEGLPASMAGVRTYLQSRRDRK